MRHTLRLLFCVLLFAALIAEAIASSTVATSAQLGISLERGVVHSGAEWCDVVPSQLKPSDDVCAGFF